MSPDSTAPVDSPYTGVALGFLFLCVAIGITSAVWVIAGGAVLDIAVTAVVAALVIGGLSYSFVRFR